MKEPSKKSEKTHTKTSQREIVKEKDAIFAGASNAKSKSSSKSKLSMRKNRNRSGKQTNKQTNNFAQNVTNEKS